jgi:Flp pilus assembly protein TadG
MILPVIPRIRPGAALLEMAILLPFVVLLFVIAVDFSRVYYTTQVLQNCAQVGAVYASGTAHPRAGESAEQAAKRAALAEGKSLQPGLKEADVTVNVTSDEAAVTVSHSFSMIIGYPGFPRTVTLKRTNKLSVVPRVGE